MAVPVVAAAGFMTVIHRYGERRARAIASVVAPVAEEPAT
jgi:hypothetical protein